MLGQLFTIIFSRNATVFVKFIKILSLEKRASTVNTVLTYWHMYRSQLTQWYHIIKDQWGVNIASRHSKRVGNHDYNRDNLMTKLKSLEQEHQRLLSSHNQTEVSIIVWCTYKKSTVLFAIYHSSEMFNMSYQKLTPRLTFYKYFKNIVAGRIWQIVSYSPKFYSQINQKFIWHMHWL